MDQKGFKCIQRLNMLFLTGKKPRTKAPKIQRLVTPRVLQHKRRRIALKKHRTLKNKEEAAEYTKMLAKRMKVCGCLVIILNDGVFLQFNLVVYEYIFVLTSEKEIPQLNLYYCYTNEKEIPQLNLYYCYTLCK